MARIEKDYRRAVIYQIYVKSFCDSDGDGLGDLPGIIGKLDYLERLGVDYLWLTPFFPSPQHDNGYDVSDYCAVDPRYGTMADFDELVAKAAEKGMGIMLDMVLCHTSVEHEWFRRACAGEERYQRYYILRDGRGASGPGDPGEPPTNWQCAFGGSAWKWEPRLGKWYLHLHDVSQPDLDWANPEVRAALADVVRFWRERGVTGFRFDVINLISKPEVFEDVPGSGAACRALVADGPHVHEYLQELVASAGIDGMITVGEMASTDLANCIRYTRPEDHELSMSFSFHHLKVDYAGGDKWTLMEPDIARLRETLRTWQEGMQAGGGWNALFWDNHDQPRAITRFGGRAGVGERGGSWERVGKMLAVCDFFMKGTPYIYQGDELGMTNAGYTSIEQYDDVESHNNYRLLMERGATADEAVAMIRDWLDHVRILFTPYDLKYAKKSGRISAAAAVLGDALGIHPIMSFPNGDSKVLAKVRGDKALVPAMLKIAKKERKEGTPYIQIMGSYDVWNEELTAACPEALGEAPVLSYYIGGTISINAGPNVVGLIYYMP